MSVVRHGSTTQICVGTDIRCRTTRARRRRDDRFRETTRGGLHDRPVHARRSTRLTPDDTAGTAGQTGRRLVPPARARRSRLDRRARSGDRPVRRVRRRLHRRLLHARLGLEAGPGPAQAGLRRAVRGNRGHRRSRRPASHRGGRTVRRHRPARRVARPAARRGRRRPVLHCGRHRRGRPNPDRPAQPRRGQPGRHAGRGHPRAARGCRCGGAPRARGRAGGPDRPAGRAERGRLGADRARRRGLDPARHVRHRRGRWAAARDRPRRPRGQRDPDRGDRGAHRRARLVDGAGDDDVPRARHRLHTAHDHQVPRVAGGRPRTRGGDRRCPRHGRTRRAGRRQHRGREHARPLRDGPVLHAWRRRGHDRRRLRRHGGGSHSVPGPAGVRRPLGGATPAADRSALRTAARRGRTRCPDPAVGRLDPAHRPPPHPRGGRRRRRPARAGGAVPRRTVWLRRRRQRPRGHVVQAGVRHGRRKLRRGCQRPAAGRGAAVVGGRRHHGQEPRHGDRRHSRRGDDSTADDQRRQRRGVDHGHPGDRATNTRRPKTWCAHCGTT